jgi:hypothetical protein
VVGNGGILSRQQLGPTIDSYDVVIRLNSAPTFGYEAQVGRKTHVRIVYPESADIPHMDKEDFSETTFVVAMHSPNSIVAWLEAVLSNSSLDKDVRFWKKPGDPRIFSNFSTQMRILNPNVVQVAHNILNNTRKRPTSGLIAFVFATRVCDSVDLAGFAYNNPDPNATVHYYLKTLMSSLKNQGSPTVYDISKEVELMKTMAEANLVGDLSRVIWPSEK